MSSEPLTAIQACSVNYSYSIKGQSVEVLNDISFSIKKGEVIFLYGASGAGKTTLLYLMAGLEKPQSGKVIIQDQEMWNLSTKRRANFRNQKIGYIFQNYLLIKELTALENVLLPRMIGGKSGRSEAMELLESLGIAHRASHLVDELSGGEKQRVAVARALINRPEVIFADEPTGNLNSKIGHLVMESLINLSRENKVTLIIVTHDETLKSLGDRTFYLKDGYLSIASSQ